MTTPTFNAADVSIVIPTCNRCDILKICLHALAAQTAAPREIIVIDDCSTDETPARLTKFAQDHPQILLKQLRNDMPRGANASRNRGIGEAAGSIIAFLDNDSIAQPDWLEQLMRGFVADDIAAVVGRVNDPPANNVFELTFRGTHRLPGPGPARRLIAGNMAVRRDLVLRYILDEDIIAPQRDAQGQPDTSTSAGCDEEGIFLRMKAAGLRAVVVPEAVVVHEHYYKGRAFFKQAWHGGRSAARLVYKYYLPQRMDMLPFIFAYGTLPLGFLSLWLLLVPALFFAIALAAITYNDLFLKGKTVVQTLITFPILLAYYHVRLVGYVFESLRLRMTNHNLKRVRLNASS